MDCVLYVLGTLHEEMDETIDNDDYHNENDDPGGNDDPGSQSFGEQSFMFIYL